MTVLTKRQRARFLEKVKLVIPVFLFFERFEKGRKEVNE